MTEPTETKPPKAKRVDVIVLRPIGGENGMINPSPDPVSLPIEIAKKLQDAGAVKIHLGD
jgi:hypothetical protein